MPEVWLNVAEKPSVAKEVANVLGGGRQRHRQTSSPQNPAYEFPYNGVSMVMTSVRGHVMEDDFGPETRGWASFPFAELFHAPITRTVKPDCRAIETSIKDLARRATRLVLWLDCDREGENICFEVIAMARSAGGRAAALPVSRARFSALTARDLEHAMAHLVPPDEWASDAVAARQEMDLRIGAVFTRFQTVRLRDHFADMPRPLSFGPCQLPCLGFVVQRHWERAAFVPEAFFHAQLSDAGSDGAPPALDARDPKEGEDGTAGQAAGARPATTMAWDRGHLYDRAAATIIVEQMALAAATQDAGNAVVLDVQRKPSRKAAPVPLATVALQKLCSQHLRMSSDETMSVAEALYQEGFLSYPRTETDVFTYTDQELLALAKLQADGAADWSPFARDLLQDPQAKYKRPRAGGHDDKAHPPIHPTKFAPHLVGGGDPKARLYALVARHFLACMSPDAEAADTQVKVLYGGERFHCGGHTVTARQWLEVYPYERWTSSRTVPNYAVGDRFVPARVDLLEGVTQPPAHLTEPQLIGMMDDYGIGTDATIAQHIKTICDRQYAAVTSGLFVPTQLGMALAAAYSRLGLSRLWQPQLRAQTERAMADIATGKATKAAVVAAAIAQYTEIFAQAAGSVDAMLDTMRGFLAPRRVAAAQVVVRHFTDCGRCGGAMQLAKEQDEAPAAVCVPCGLRCRLPGNSSLEATTDVCPLCQFRVLKVTNTQSGKSHVVCTHCFGTPPAGVGDIEQAGELRCFQCTHVACQHAGGTVPIGRCPSCAQHPIRLRTAGSGRPFIGCRGFPACDYSVFLPACTSAVVAPGTCGCGMRLIGFTFSFPPPGTDPVDELCVFCDPRLETFVQIKASRRAPPTGAQAPQAAAQYAMPQIVEAPALRGRRGRGGARGAAGGGGARGGRGGRGAAAPPPGPVPQCQCNAPARQATSRKAASSGCRFWTCADRKCKFFSWIDQPPQP